MYSRIGGLAQLAIALSGMLVAGSVTAEDNGLAAAGTGSLDVIPRVLVHGLHVSEVLPRRAIELPQEPVLAGREHELLPVGAVREHALRSGQR